MLIDEITYAETINIPGSIGKIILGESGIGSYCVKLVEPNQKKAVQVRV